MYGFCVFLPDLLDIHSYFHAFMFQSDVNGSLQVSKNPPSTGEETSVTAGKFKTCSLFLAKKKNGCPTSDFQRSV